MTVKGMEGETLSIIHEAISMLRVIVAFGREDHEYRRFRDQGKRAIDARIRVTVRQTLFSLAVNTTTAIGTALVLGFGAYLALSRAADGRRTADRHRLHRLRLQAAGSDQHHDRLAPGPDRHPADRVRSARHGAGDPRPARRDRDRAGGGARAVRRRHVQLSGPRRHARQTSRWKRRPARRSRSSGRRAPARPRWSACCRGSTTRRRAASCSTASTSAR